MNETDFLQHFLIPSETKLNDAYRLPLPDVPDLKRVGDFIVQSEAGDTFSVNLVRKYRSENLGVVVKEVYKNTENTRSGAFVRLVGTISYLRKGYPRLVVDAPVSNIGLAPGDGGRLMTRVFVVFPQAESEMRQLVFDRVKLEAEANGIGLKQKPADSGGAPSAYFCDAPGVDPGLITSLRNCAWRAYRSLIDGTSPVDGFDYRPVLSERIFNTAVKESVSFAGKGLSVPVEAQQAFFCTTTGGIE